jgi:hypothetical protein
MKKFSNITNAKVGEEPKVEVKKLNEEDMFKHKVLNLMDQFLSIQTYGPVDRYLRAGNIKISGKETFLEALMSLMDDKSNKTAKAVLESLKGEVGDWEAIDSKIEEVKSKIEENSKSTEEVKHRDKVLSIYNKYGSDKTLCLSMFEKHIDKITDGESAYMKYVVSEKISTNHDNSELFKEVSEKYLERSKQLGFNK